MQLSAPGELFLLQGLILAMGLFSLGMGWWSARTGSPVTALFGRWARWFFISLLIGLGLHLYGGTGYPFPTLAVVAFLGWFVIETGYNWLAINALSKSELPLFPKFEENESGEEWPSTRACIRIKDWLRDNGFKRRQALVSFLGELVLMRSSVYENVDQTVRINILFLPNHRGGTAVCFTLYTATRGGDLIVTDNIFLPFGGFYPENWDVERSAWTRSLRKLHQRHRERIDAKAQPLAPFVLSPLEQINTDQRTVEQLNRDMGFLYQPHDVPEQGRVTPAGKARIWQEIWMLAYLGIPLRYN